MSQHVWRAGIAIEWWSEDDAGPSLNQGTMWKARQSYLCYTYEESVVTIR